ncbi:MAG TPA: type II secretion system F family protein [Xanthobacteraceae bacterium]|nr:type II secretion system F family protein [Xanthobacteraceae bacterium]
MIELLFALFDDKRILAMICAAIAAGATVITLAMPLLGGNELEKRMAAVAAEREKIRQRERERLARGDKTTRRASPKQYMQTVVEKFNLSNLLGEETMRSLLVQAGYRGEGPYVVFLFFRMVAPLSMLASSAFYVFVLLKLDYPWTVNLGICLAATYLGMYLPNLFVKNKITRRQASINRGFPDSLDLMLICVESGMSLESTFQRVSQEIGTQSIELAEELTLATAELSYLPDRRLTFENLAKRVPLDGVKSLCLALQQSEKFGTPLAQTLRVIAQENRDQRMTAAEKKAAALPPQLTVPMILFFLPVLFVVILGPAVIKVMETWK